MLAGSVYAQATGPDAPIELRTTPALQPSPRGDAARRLPIVLEAQSVTGSPDLEAVAEGNAEFRRGGVKISADRLRYEQADDLATALGHVRISRDGNVYTGPELHLKVERFEGFFLSPTYYFARTGAGDPNAGQTEHPDAITAVVLGGTSLFGGRGIILGSRLGAVIVGVFRNGLTLMGVPSVFQVLITDVLVILAVATDQLSRKGAR